MIVTSAVGPEPSPARRVQNDPAGGVLAAGAVYVDVNVPLARVKPPSGLQFPQVPATGTMVIVAPLTGFPALVSVTVSTELPDGCTDVGLAVKEMAFGAAVWFTVAEPVCPANASLPVMVAAGVPGVVDDLYVVVATPLALVTANTLLTVPAVAPATVNITVSPTTGVPGAGFVVVTRALMLEVLVPSAGMLDGEAVTATETPVGVGFAIWSISDDFEAPVADSVAVTVQNPDVVDAWYNAVTGTLVAPVLPDAGLMVPQAALGLPDRV
jgi:hypothetical protein